MNRILSVSALFGFVTCSSVSAAQRANVSAKPDILIIMPDQMRGDCLSTLGHPVVHTPNLDKLAQDGVMYRRAYTTCPSCIPARFAMLTGRSPQSSGVVGYAQKKFDSPLMPALLGDAGYTTVLVGCTMDQKPTNASHGYQREIEGSTYVDDDEYDTYLKQAAPESGGIGNVIKTTKVSLNQLPAHPWPLDPALHPTSWTIRESRKVVAGTPADQPLFLTTSFLSPHPPLFALPKYHNAILKMNLPQPAHGTWLEQKNPGGGDGRTGIKGEALQQAQAGYYGLIDQIDDEMAPLIADFKARSEKAHRPWVIVFTSDHGEQLADHGYFRKCEPYEGSANIPFVIAGSPDLGFKKGMRKSQLATLEDLMPTLLALAGAPTPPIVDGVNLVPSLRDESTKTRDLLHLEHSAIYSRHQAFQCLTDGRYKYIWRPFFGEEQLFDLNADPHEEHDLASAAGDQSLLLQWRGKLIQRLKGRPEGFTDGTKLNIVTRYPAIMRKATQAKQPSDGAPAE